MTDEKIVAANYLTSFYQELETITWESGQYINTIRLMELKYQTKNKSGESFNLSDEDKQTMTAMVAYIKNLVFKTYVKYKALSTKIEGLNEEEIEKSYQKIKNCETDLPPVEDIERYVLALNTAFVKGILSDVLRAGELLRGLS